MTRSNKNQSPTLKTVVGNNQNFNKTKFKENLL